MRLIDADALYKSFEEVYEHPDSMFIDAAWWFFGKLEDAPTIPPPPNDPLTLEELRTMDGGPVWCVGRSGEGRWGIVHFYDEDGFECYMTEYGRIDGWCYGSDGEYGWLAYRRKPEKGKS